MAVFSVENGVVVQVWKNLGSLEEFARLYGDSAFDLAVGDAVPGQLWDGTKLSTPTMTRETQRKAAFARLDDEHGAFLATVTGATTAAERDTWKTKEEAARAFEAGQATMAQTEMLSVEAQGRGITKADLAAIIISKADAYIALIGVAGGLRGKARAEIMSATDDAVPLAEVALQIATIFEQLSQGLRAAGLEFRQRSARP